MLNVKQVRRSLVKNADQHVVGRTAAEEEEHINREIDLVRLPCTQSLLHYLNNSTLPSSLKDEDPKKWWHELEKNMKCQMLLPEGALQNVEISFELRDERPRILIHRSNKFRSCYFVKLTDVSDTPSSVKYMKQMGCVADMFPLEDYNFLSIRLNNRLNPLIIIFSELKEKELIKTAANVCMQYVRDAREAISNAEQTMQTSVDASKLPAQFVRMIGSGIQVSMFCGRYIKKDVSLRMTLSNHDIVLSHEDGSDYKFPISMVLRVATTTEWLEKMQDPRTVAIYENLGFLVPLTPVEDANSPAQRDKSPTPTASSPTTASSALNPGSPNAGYASDASYSPLPMRKKVTPGKKGPLFSLVAVADDPAAYEESMPERGLSFYVPDAPVYTQMKKKELLSLSNVASLECNELTFPVMLSFSEKQLADNFCYFVQAAQKILGHPVAEIEIGNES